MLLRIRIKSLLFILVLLLFIFAGCSRMNQPLDNKYNDTYLTEYQDSVLNLLQGNWEGISIVSMRYEGKIISKTDSTITYQIWDAFDTLNTFELSKQKNIGSDSVKIRIDSNSIQFEQIEYLNNKRYLIGNLLVSSTLWKVLDSSSQGDHELMKQVGTKLPIKAGIQNHNISYFNVYKDSLQLEMTINEAKERMEHYNFIIKAKRKTVPNNSYTP